MSDIKVGIIADDKTSKGIKSAQKNIGNLDGSVKNLAKTFASVFAAQKVISFGKAAAQAFMEDQKSASLLANTMKNLGLQFSNPQVEAFIGKLSAAAGVADDVLRPAMQKLLTTTGSVVNSQKMLANAIDISRGSGVELGTVVQDLANAYVGNTKGLKKYNLGLTQAELKASSFLDIQKKLNDQFSGSSAAYLETYAGKMDILNTAAGEAKETIGKGLIDALAKLSGGSTVEDAAKNLQSIADAISSITGAVSSFIGLGVKAYKALDFIASFGGITGDKGKIAEQVAASKEAEKQRMAILKHSGRSSSPAGSWLRTQQQRKAEEEAKKRADEIRKMQEKLLKAQKAATAEQKKQALLKKQGTLFDMQQIELVAALKGKLSDEERKRVELQLALLQGNEEEAKKLTSEIANSIDKTGNLAKYLQTLPDANNPFKNWSSYLDAIEAQAKRIASITGGGTGGGGTTPPPSTNTDAMTWTVGGTAGANGGSYGGQVQVSVNFQGADSLSQALRDSFVSASMEGSFSQINRTVGAFDR